MLLVVRHTENGRQNITWIDKDHTSLSVHTGVNGLGRTPVSHLMLRQVFHRMLADIRQDLALTGVPSLQLSQFEQLKDSSTSTHAGEGLGYFNQVWSVEEFARKHSDATFRQTFLEKACRILRLCACLIHISGGPSPRGTEEAVTRLLNSQTEQQRNVVFIDGTIGVQGGYVSLLWYVTSRMFINAVIRYMKQRKYTSGIGVLVKFLPFEFAVVLANIILMVKPVEAEFASLLHQTCPEQTKAFLFTEYGSPVNPDTMSAKLSASFKEYGLDINMADLRHAMDAFAHKLGRPCAVWDPILVSLANHQPSTSARYGRDEHNVIDVPADICEENGIRLVV